MSKSVFSRCDGCIARVNIDCDKCPGGTANIEIGGANIGFPISGFQLELEGNYQFQHTVNKFIYAYIFGDRVGLLTLSGFGFLGNPCNAVMGVERDISLCSIYDYYKNHRVARPPHAYVINVGGCGTMIGFLTGMRMGVDRPDVPVVQWFMRFHVIFQGD